MRCYIFDLDDTLFREIDWVRSALKHCAEITAELYALNSEEVFQNFWKGLQERGRGRVFRVSFKELGISDGEEFFPYLYYRYRTHCPDNIQLMPGVEYTLSELRARSSKLGLITDGVLTAQQNKVKALGLDKQVDAVIYTEVFGYEFRKPASLPFEAMKKWLGEGDYFYIADNPDKDFIGAREAGYKTIMLRDEGNLLKIKRLEKKFRADYEIDRIEDILEI